LSGTAYRPVLSACGAIALPDRLTFEQRLARLFDEMTAVVDTYHPTLAAVEAPFHGVSARSALQLAHARGVILASLGRAGIPIHEYSPATIKKSVTGSGRAEKFQVQAMVTRLLASERAIDGPDVADAAAAALCHLFGAGFQTAVAQAMRGGRRP
jgi:crossover junction endodeoxyribonuclease RuvC